MNRWLIVPVRGLHSTQTLKRGPLVHPGWYPRDHQPGFIQPRNEVERRAAAIKYGIRPEDYVASNPDDPNMYAGDYPDFGNHRVTFDHKDPYENYTDGHMRRNWGEMAPMTLIINGPHRATFTGLEEEDFSWRTTLKLFAQLFIPMGLLWWYISDSDPNRLRWKSPAMPKVFPYDYYRAFPFEDPTRYPIVNYSFEPANAPDSHH